MVVSCSYRSQVLPSFSIVLVLFLIFLTSATLCNAEIPCESDFNCQQILQRNESSCVDGLCSNPFQQGCLKTAGLALAGPSYPFLIEGRICNSDDENNTFSSPLCITSPQEAVMNYPEIRIHHGNWETSIFQAWIYQIIFMEILGVPATVGLATADTKDASFYSPRNTIEFSAETYPYEAIQMANQVGDCAKTEDPCAHILPEVWEAQYLEIDSMIKDGSIIRPATNGQIGTGGLHVPAFTANEFPSVLSFYGLRGESRRQFLAETFKRPTTWLEYCQEVSENRCEKADGTATRFPNSEDEEQLYYSEGQYNGYFQFTNGTGHAVLTPCSWSENMEGILFWNNIVGIQVPEPPYYSAPAMLQIWRAANATKSHVLFQWYEPDRMIEEFRGTDAEFVPVKFPYATQECVENKPIAETKCSNDTTARRGPEVASCGPRPTAQFKVVSRYVGEYNLQVAEAFQSPSLDLITSLTLTTTEIETILNNWLQIGTDRNGNDSREAVCGWVVDNIDKVIGYIPKTYPRTIRSNNDSYQLLYGAMAMGIISILFVLTAAAAVYILRNEMVIKYAQVDFVLVLLGGLSLVAVGATVASIRPSNASCTSAMWLVVIGYTLELGPLIVKASAINKMMAASKRMKRVRLRRQTLFGSVFVISMIALVFVICWTVVGPWTLQEELVLAPPDDEHAVGGIVDVHFFCGSTSVGWPYTSFGWRVLLLLWATVLAIQMRQVRSEFNESQQLAFVIYSHFIFVVLQIVIVPLEAILPHEALAGYRSFILSFDVIATIVIYFTPKLLGVYEPVKSQETKQIFSNVVKRVSVAVFPPVQQGNNAAGHQVDGAKRLEESRAGDLSLEQLERLLVIRRRKSYTALSNSQNETFPDQASQRLDDVAKVEEEDSKSGKDSDLSDVSGVCDLSNAGNLGGLERNSTDTCFVF